MESGEGVHGAGELTSPEIEDSGPSTAQLARAAFGAAYPPPPAESAPLAPALPPLPPPDPEVVRRRTLVAVIGWSLAVVLVIVAGFATVGALNRQVFSAGGFVQQYLSALEGGNAVEALSMPGVQASTPSESAIESVEPSTTSDALLRASVLRGPTNIRIVSDTRGVDGVHTVRASYTLGGAPGSTTFKVANTGSIAGVFPTWRFAVSPLAVLNVAVLHSGTFEVNGLRLDARASADLGSKPGFSNTGSYFAFSPGMYSLSHSSEYLQSEKSVVRSTEAGSQDVTVDAQPTQAFAEAVQTELNKYLNSCTTQLVLQPSACPFGVEIDDRVISDPLWSIVSYPVVTLAAADNAFAMPQTDGVAHIEVEVKSLFDGDIETRSSDEPFTLSLTVTISEQGSLDIRLS